MVQTTKFYLTFCEQNGMDYKRFCQIVFDVQREVRAFKNRASNEFLSLWMRSEEWKRVNGAPPKPQDILGDSFPNHLYHIGTGMIPDLNSGNVAAEARKLGLYFSSRGGDIKFGKSAVPTFKNDQPVTIRANNIRLDVDDETGDIFLTLSILSKPGMRKYEMEDGRFTFRADRKAQSAMAILARCVSGEYKPGNGQLQYDKRKKRWKFALSYNFPPSRHQLDPDRVLGIDLGICIPMVAAISDGSGVRFYHGQEIQHFRDTTEAMRKEFRKARRYAGNGSAGHGRKKRMLPVDRIGARVANFRSTKNDALSRDLVDYAVRKKCGTIQMEDLSGITAGKRPKFLKDWTYYDLQSKIKYKAEAAGIRVVMVKPRYTSQRCSKCGYISSDNRPDQEHFVCQCCGHTENADLNAARNIATPGIEGIIRKQCKLQGIKYDKKKCEEEANTEAA